MAGILLVISAAFMWALDTLIRYPLVDRGINPITIVFYEQVVLSLFFSFGLFRSIRSMGDLRLSDVASFLIVGAFGQALGTVAFTESFVYLNPSLVILLQKLQPAVVIVLAAFVLKEEVQKKFLIWAGVCLVGGFLVSSPDIERLYSLMVNDFNAVISDVAIQGYGLVGISILAWGSATVFGKRLTMVGFETKAIMGGRFLIGLISLLPFVKLDRTLLLPQGEDYLRILIMVLISGALAMYCYYQGLKRLSAKTTAIAEMFFPFFAIIVNWIFLGKQLTEIQLLGGAILIIGSLVIQIKKY